MLKFIIRYIITFRYINLLAYRSTKWLFRHISVIPIVDSEFLIKILPQKVLNRLQDMHQISKQKPYKLKHVYYYGFNFIHGAINKGLLLIILGLLFNILPQIILTMLSFVSVRIFVGGLHFNSYTKCAYISLLSFLIMSLLAKYVYLPITIIISIFITIFVLYLLYAPVENKNRPIKEKDKKKFKIISLSVLSILLLVIVNICNEMIINCIAYGVLLSGIISLPIINNDKKCIKKCYN